MKKRKNLGTLIVLLAVLLTPLTGLLIRDDVRAQEALPEPSTTIRVFHAATGQPAVSISVDGQVMVPLLGYGEATQYQSVTPGTHEFVVADPDGGMEPITVSADVDDGDAATVVLVNTDAGMELRTFEVNLDRTDTGKARVRLINASDVGGIDFYANDDRWFDGVDPADASDYKDVDWGMYSVLIEEQDADEPLFSFPETMVNWGNVYDVVVFGSQSDDSLRTIVLVTTVSPRCTLLFDIQGFPADACLRIGNLAPSGLPVTDVYYNNARIVENMGVGDRLSYVAVPVYEYEVPIQIVPAGMGTDYGSLYRYVELRPGEAYEMFIVGSANSPSVVGARVNLTPPPVGQGRWRILHGYPDAAAVDVVIKDGPVLFSDVSYQDVTDYVVIDAGTYTIQIVDHETGSMLFEKEVVIEAGMVYDSVVSYSVEVTVDPEEATPVAITGQNAAIVTFASPTFPRGGVIVPVTEPADQGTPTAEATPEA